MSGPEKLPLARVIGRCPSCGSYNSREPYDIGDGPELCCAECEWCWGAEGQLLHPIPLQTACPECGATEGAPCVGVPVPPGQPAAFIASHQARFDANMAR